jgi:hypothetical protein
LVKSHGFIRAIPRKDGIKFSVVMAASATQAEDNSKPFCCSFLPEAFPAIGGKGCKR